MIRATNGALFGQPKPMIGQFKYEHEPTEASVVLLLVWSDNEASGRVVMGQKSTDILEDLSYPVVPESEVMQLPFALSYGVIVTAITNGTFCISGDRSVWPSHWGKLRTSS